MVMEFARSVPVPVHGIRLAVRARIFAEDQRLDRDRHRHRRHPDPPEIDKVEAPQRDAVDHQHFAADARIFLQQVAQRQCDVGVDDEVQRAAGRQRARQRVHQALRQGIDPGVGRRAAPAQRDGVVLVAFDQVVSQERSLERRSHLGAIDRVRQRQGQRHHLQVLARQQHPGLGNEGGVSTQLHAVLGRSQHRGADALARLQQRPRQRPRIQPVADRLAEQLAEVTEIARLAAVDVLADAARKHDAVEPTERRQRVGQQQLVDVAFGEPLLHDSHQRVGHGLCHPLQLRALDHASDLPVEACSQGMAAAGRIKPGDAAGVVHHQQPAAQVDGGGGLQFALVDQAELAGAAADVDVEDSGRVVERAPRRARTVHRQHALHVVAGGGADELAALLGQDRCDRLRVLAPQGFAGEDHCAGVDVVGMQSGAGIRLLDDLPERRDVDQRVALVGGQRVRRLVQRLA